MEEVKENKQFADIPLPPESGTWKNKTYDKETPYSPQDRTSLATEIEGFVFGEKLNDIEILNRPLIQLADNTLVNDTIIRATIENIYNNENGFLKGFEFVSSSNNTIEFTRGIYILNGKYIDFINYIQKGKKEVKQDNITFTLDSPSPNTTYYIQLDESGDYYFNTSENSNYLTIGSIQTDANSNFDSNSYQDLRKTLKPRPEVSDIKHSEIQDDEPEKHRLIDDSNPSLTTLYSGQKIENELATKSDIGHTHDDRYYTETETDALLSNKIDKVIGATEDNVATLTLAGEVKDSGLSINETATKTYVQQYVQGLDWQESVLDKDLTTPPDPSELSGGERYLLYNEPTADTDWEGHKNDIAEWNGSEWIFTTPNKGFTCEAEDEAKYYTFNGTEWVLMASLIHITF